MSALIANQIEEIPVLQGPTFEANAEVVAGRVREWLERGCTVQFNWHVLQKELATGVEGLAPTGLVERFLEKTRFAYEEEETAAPTGNESGAEESPRVDLILTLHSGNSGTDWRNTPVIYCMFTSPDA